MRRVGPAEDAGPMFFLVFEVSPSVWDSRAYWSSSAANHARLMLESKGRLAFVEAR